MKRKQRPNTAAEVAKISDETIVWLAVIRKLDFNPDIVNINGGAIALGHPLGCTGCKLTIQITHEMKRRNKKYGLVTACVGGGQGIAGIIENIN